MEHKHTCVTLALLFFVISINSMVSNTSMSLESFYSTIPLPFKKVPLVWAAHEGQIHLVKILLAQVDVNQTAIDGSTALSKAVQKGHIKIVTLLLNNKANVNMSDTFGPPLYYAVCNGNNKITKLLLERKPNVNLSNAYGETPLFWAVRKKNMELIKLLLAHNADVNKATMFGETPIFYALDNIETVKLLLEHNANINIVNGKFGGTPLSWASMSGYLEVIKLFLIKKVTLKDCLCSLSVSIKHGKQEAVALLRECINSAAEDKYLATTDNKGVEN